MKEELITLTTEQQLEQPKEAVPKKRSKLKIISSILGAIMIVWVAIYFMPAFKKVSTPFADVERPLVIAHQGGEHLAPSNTLASFTNAMDLGVDVIEFDIHMTKDGYLVAIHDATVDRTTDGTGRVNDLTLAEIKQLDAGHYFKDLNGEFSFQNKGVEIPTVEEAFEAVPNMKWNIEIKDTNDPELFEDIAEKLWLIIQDYHLEEDVLIASFDQDIIDIMLDVSDGQAFVSGGRAEITKFVIIHKLFLNGLYRPTVNAIQIPTEDSNINLKSRGLIKGANRLGMDVHYWTINDKEKMKELIELGADGIITDRPDLMMELLDR